jgi:hypothetical protein
MSRIYDTGLYSKGLACQKLLRRFFPPNFKQCRTFRHATQTFLLEAVVRLTDVEEEREVLARKQDLVTIGRLLHSFHTAGVLAWGTPSWRLVAYWLRTRQGCGSGSALI